MLNYEQDARIQENALEQEWLDQAALAIKYGKEYARLRKKVALLDEKVKVIRSELINEAYDHPEKCSGGKVNQQNAEAYYRDNKKHKKAKKKLIEAQYELDLIEIAKNEMSFTRKATLENLVKLHAADYFAGPSVPRDITKERKNREASRKETNKQIPALKLKKKSKKDKKKKK